MSQTTIQYQQTCEICGIVHENNGTLCNNQKCADGWLEKYISLDSLEISKTIK